MDQCKNCTLRGDVSACERETCNLHDSWYVETLRLKVHNQEVAIFRLEAKVKQLSSRLGWIENPDRMGK